MTESTRQPDDPLSHVSDQLGKDLRGIFQPPRPVSRQTDEAILSQARRILAKPHRFTIPFRWAAGVAACLAVAVLGWWVASSHINTTRPSALVASSAKTTLKIESAASGCRISAGSTIETSSGQMTGLILNDKHQVVLNAGTRLAIEPLSEMGRDGCLLNLALGEIWVHVAHDGNPFVVQTAHGRSVITGTTFDVKASDAGTTLVVVEGSVRFESQEKAVQVAAGQQSMIARAVGTPTLPTSCDAAILTAWARSTHDETQVAQDIPPDDSLLRDLPPLPTEGVRTDLKSLNYTQWIAQNRDWFKQQFPDIFRLQAALADEGIQAEYPDLLLASAMAWQFAYPPTNRNQLLPADNTAIVRAASRYGKDSKWLTERGLLTAAAPDQSTQRRNAEAFTLWRREWDALESDKETPRELLLNSLHACIYLRQTRSLLWLMVETGRQSLPGLSQAELQALLQTEVAAADTGVSNVIQLLAANQSILSCDTDPYRRLVQEAGEAIRQMARNQEILANETEDCYR